MPKTKQRGRPPKKMPKRINAPPELVAAALFAPNDTKVKKRRAKQG